jgi:hypothetical protein
MEFSACCCLQDFERLLQDVNRTTYKEIKVYVDEVSLPPVGCCAELHAQSKKHRVGTPSILMDTKFDSHKEI